MRTGAFVASAAAVFLLAGCHGQATNQTGYHDTGKLAASYAAGVQTDSTVVVTRATCAPTSTAGVYTCQAWLSDGSHITPARVAVADDGSSWVWAK